MKTSIKFFSLLLTICILFSAINIPVSADSSKFSAGGYKFEYGKYFGSGDDYLWIYKNKTFKHKSPYAEIKGTWKIKSDKYATNMCMYPKNNKSYYVAFSLTEGNNKLLVNSLDSFGASGVYYKCPPKVKIKKLSKGKNYVKVSWSKVKASYFSKSSSSIGYEIQYSTNKSFKNKKLVRVYSASTTSKKIYDLKKNKKYYFRVRSFTIKEKYEYSETKNYCTGNTFSFNDYSSTKSFKAPKNCKELKTISKNTAKEKAYKVYISKYKKSVPKKYLGQTKIYGKKYYIFSFQQTYINEIGNTWTSGACYAVSLDGQEIKKIMLFQRKNYKLNKCFYYVYFNVAE